MLIERSAPVDFRFLKNAARARQRAGWHDKPDEPDVVLEAEVRRASGGGPAQAPPHRCRSWPTITPSSSATPRRRTSTSTFATALVEAVRERGVGLVVAAGRRFTPHGLDAGCGLLPVRLQRRRRARCSLYKAFQLELSPDGAVHEMMRLYDDPGPEPDRVGPDAALLLVPQGRRAARARGDRPGLEPERIGRFGKLPLLAYHYAGAGSRSLRRHRLDLALAAKRGRPFLLPVLGQALRFVARREERKGCDQELGGGPRRSAPGPVRRHRSSSWPSAGRRASPTRADVDGPDHRHGRPRNHRGCGRPATKGRYVGKHAVKAPVTTAFAITPAAGSRRSRR